MSANEMDAAFMIEPRTIKIGRAPIPKTEAGEVKVKIETVGVCGSDLHLFERGAVGSYVVQYPYVLGHEAAGEIVELGDGVTGLRLGDRVALEPGKTCGKCEFCKSGRYNLCKDVVFFAAPPYQGVFCEYVCHPAELCFKLPSNVSSKEGALIEPLSVGMHAVRQAGAVMGQSATVIGLGCIGLVTIMALKAAGIDAIYAVDIMENRLKMAEELGAVPIDPNKAGADTIVMQATDGIGTDMVFETAGTPFTTSQTVSYAKTGGVIVLVGMAADVRIEYSFFDFICKELTLKSVFRYRNLYPTAISAVASGRIPLAKIITNEYDFYDIGRALNESIDNKGGTVKSIINMK